MNKKLKKALSVFLAILMLLSSAPLEGLTGMKAEAVKSTTIAGSYEYRFLDELISKSTSEGLGVWTFDYSYTNALGESISRKKGDNIDNMTEYLIHSIYHLLYSGAFQNYLLSIYQYLSADMAPVIYEYMSSYISVCVPLMFSIYNHGLALMPHLFASHSDAVNGNTTLEHYKSDRWYKFFNGFYTIPGTNATFPSYPKVLNYFNRYTAVQTPTSNALVGFAKPYWSGWQSETTTDANGLPIFGQHYNYGDKNWQALPEGLTFSTENWDETYWNISNHQDFIAATTSAACGLSYALRAMFFGDSVTIDDAAIGVVASMEGTLHVSDYGYSSLYDTVILPLFDFIGITKGKYGRIEFAELKERTKGLATTGSSDHTTSSDDSITQAYYLWDAIFTPIFNFIDTKLASSSPTDIINTILSVLTMLETSQRATTKLKEVGFALGGINFTEMYAFNLYDLLETTLEKYDIKLFGKSENFYSAGAAVEYARKYALSYNKEWYFYKKGGDCANYVSQCLYAGGYQMTSEWHCYDNNTYAYWADELGKNSYTWIRADELKNYLVSQGGTQIHKPDNSDFSLGDAVFYDWDGDGSMDHSAIVTAIDNGIPKVSCHTKDEKYSKLDALWTLGESKSCAYLIKLNGNPCYNDNASSYDYYQLNKTASLYKDLSRNSVLATIKKPVTAKTVRVTETSGSYGYTNYIGNWGWLSLANSTHLGSHSKIDVTHAMSGWYTVKKATCSSFGLKLDVCSKCGYTQQKLIDKTAHRYKPATCTKASYCSVCGATTGKALGHNWDDGTITKSPSCTATGTKTYTCKRCGITKTSTIAANGHKWGNYVTTKAATCTTDGISTSTCSVCSITKTKAIAALGHKLSDTTVAATCITDGYTVSKCTRESCSYSVITSTVKATGHALSPLDSGYDNSNDKMELVSSVENVCGTGTIDTYQCTHINNGSRCTYTVVIGKSQDHNMSGWQVEKQPTCYDSGLKVNKCTNDGCSYKETEVIEKRTHNMSSWTKNNDGTHTKGCLYEDCSYCVTDDCTFGDWETTKAATCEKAGERSRTCKECGYVQTETIDPTDHDWSDWIDCENSTEHSRVCKNDESHVQTVTHNFDDGTTTVTPTCEEKGIIEYHCADCNAIVTQEIDAIKHNYQLDEELSVAATCTEDGYEYYECQNDPTHNYTKPLTASGHNMSDWVDYPPENGCGEGKKMRECQKDGCDYFEEEYYIIDHTYGEEVIIPATCIDQGYTYKQCETCGDMICYNYTDVDPENHADYETSLANYTDPTCTENGQTDDTVCSACNAIIIAGEPLTALGHDYGSWVDDKNGTTHTKTCQRDTCNDTVTEHKISANHKMSEIERVPAKCTVDGYVKYKCDDCDYTYSEPLKATGHDWGEWEITTEPTYDSVGEKQQICKNDSSHINKEIIPVLTRPSEDNENITTDKTVDYDSLTGEAVIRLLASSNGKKITVKSRIPLDIVLVLDQSGSMEGQLNKKLKEAVESFNKSIYNDAVESGLDHRIAMVGFAMQDSYDFNKNEYPQYLNTEVLTTGGAPIKYNSLASNEMNKVYKDALVSVNVNNSLNPILTTATENIDSKGATATDLGLDMACKIFSQNENDGSRKRIVVLMTDGVPTYKSNYMEDTADNAKDKADLIKNTYEADIYSVGVLSGNEVNKAKTFLKDVASKDDSNAPLYYDCSESSELISSFSKIANESTTVKTDFNDVTLVDTVSKAFTLTSKQEQQLRADAIEKLGVTNSDIIVTRYADGTTEVKIQHISPKKIENGNDVKFVIDFSFSVTANENALVADSYVTNTDNAGVIVGVKDVYENNFTAPSDNVEEAEGVVYFNINGITYHVLRVHAGDKVEQPEIDLAGGYTFSGWDIPDEITFDGGKYTIDATLTQDEYTVTWITDGETATENYHFGDIITVPNVKENANGDAFDSWDKEVPTTMPAEDLTFTASYSKHEHKWVTSATVSDKDVTAFSNVYCELCGESPDETLSYTLTGTFGNSEYTYDLKLVDAKNIKVNVDGSITVSLPIPESMRYARRVKIYREEADGTLTDLNGSKSGSYITFTTDHFSKYVLKAIYECDESGKHVDANCDKTCDICGVEYPELGHKYDSLVIAPTCTEGGYTKHTCSVCGDSYSDKKVAALGHNDSNGDGKCDNCGATLQDVANNCSHLCHSTNGFVQFIWKIVRFFCKLFNINKVCSCGVKHW